MQPVVLGVSVVRLGQAEPLAFFQSAGKRSKPISVSGWASIFSKVHALASCCRKG
jgi:hypothetical protein